MGILDTISRMNCLNARSGGMTYMQRTLVQLQALSLPDADVLAAVKGNLCDRIDAAAETLRDRMTTPGTGQVMEYQEVAAEAAAALADPSPTAARYPMLAATIGVDVDPITKAPAADVSGVARAVTANHDAWLVAGAAIRKARLGGKAAIAAATTVASATDAYDAIVWPAA